MLTAVRSQSVGIFVEARVSSQAHEAMKRRAANIPITGNPSRDLREKSAFGTT
jgi:hypothetical protein